jgi:hypothetical protein
MWPFIIKSNSSTYSDDSELDSLSSIRFSFL